MDFLHSFINFMLHLDQNLLSLATHYGTWIYAILFIVLFCETGLVITPFLPGDSLLFATGAFAATGALNIHLLFILLVAAATIGNTTNYFIGKWIGPKIFHSSHSRFFNQKYLMQAHQFYQQFGGNTLIVARFIPIIRTFAPFIAGIGYMKAFEFMCCNLISAVLWVGSILGASYLFGQLPLIKDHFSALTLTIIALSLLPALLGLWRQYRVLSKRTTCNNF